MRGTALAVGFLLLLTPIGLFCLGLLLKLGIEEALVRYGTGGTVALIAGSATVFLAIAFLVDSRQDRKPRNPEDRPPTWL